MSKVLTGYPRRLMALTAPSNSRPLTCGHATWPRVLCAVALGFGVCLGFSLPAPDTIMLPDSLGPIRPPSHLAFGNSTDNIYVASESSDIIVVDGSFTGNFQRIKRINTGTPVGGALWRPIESSSCRFYETVECADCAK